MDKEKLILESAYDIFLKFGYKKTTMNDIADYAGIGKGSIYYYFKSKEAIFLALISKEADEIFEKLENMLNEENDLRKKFQIIFVDMYDLFYDYGKLSYKHFINHTEHFLKHVNEHDKFHKQRFSKIIKKLIEGLKNKNILSVNLQVDEIADLLDKRIFKEPDEKCNFISAKDFVEKMEKYREENRKILQIVLNGLIKEA